MTSKSTSLNRYWIMKHHTLQQLDTHWRNLMVAKPYQGGVVSVVIRICQRKRDVILPKVMQRSSIQSVANVINIFVSIVFKKITKSGRCRIFVVSINKSILISLGSPTRFATYLGLILHVQYKKLRNSSKIVKKIKCKTWDPPVGPIVPVGSHDGTHPWVPLSSRC